MFTKEDFELPLEKQLRLRVINTEIDECSDIKSTTRESKDLRRKLDEIPTPMCSYGRASNEKCYD